MLKLTTSLKAAFLLMVFAMNTVVGFACSIGIDMGFNSKHHEAKAVTGAAAHLHKDAKKHIHQEKKESHRDDASAGHTEEIKSEDSKSDERDCCPEIVKAFQQLDKSVTGSYGLVHPLFLSAFVAVYDNFSPIFHPDIDRDLRWYVRSYHPPISSIRIAIQSFQI